MAHIKRIEAQIARPVNAVRLSVAKERVAFKKRAPYSNGQPRYSIVTTDSQLGDAELANPYTYGDGVLSESELREFAHEILKLIGDE